jgi:hypothetical protein
MREKQIPVREFGFPALQFKKLTSKWLFPYRNLRSDAGNCFSYTDFQNSAQAIAFPVQQT